MCIRDSRSPIYTYGAIFLACISASLFVYLRFSFALTPLQQFYLPYYLRTEVAGVMHKTDKYQLLIVADARGHVHLAGDNELQAGRTIVPGGKPLALQLTPAARAAGAEILYRTAPTVYSNQPLHEYLKHDIYACLLYTSRCV